MSKLSLDHYQEQASRTAVYPGKGKGTDEALAYCALGLGEAGEVQGKIKKILRGDPQAQNNAYDAEVAYELGDVLWYVSQLAKELGFSLSEIAQHNLDKLADRASRDTLKGAGDHR